MINSRCWSPSSVSAGKTSDNSFTLIWVCPLSMENCAFAKKQARMSTVYFRETVSVVALSGSGATFTKSDVELIPAYSGE